MTNHSITATASTGPIPADDPNRALTVASLEDSSAKHISLAGNVYTILVSGEQTDGRYCLIDMLVSDGGGPPPHRHDFEEMFTLLEGELQFTFRGKTTIVAAPTTINIPANAPHGFKNVSGKSAHMLCMCTPAGQEEFFLSVADPIASRDSKPPKLSEAERAERGQKARALASKYRTEFLV
jgi:quercetin dioxygenase-like cupin family protein